MLHVTKMNSAMFERCLFCRKIGLVNGHILEPELWKMNLFGHKHGVLWIKKITGRAARSGREGWRSSGSNEALWSAKGWEGRFENGKDYSFLSFLFLNFNSVIIHLHSFDSNTFTCTVQQCSLVVVNLCFPQTAEIATSQEKQMEVCKICGAFLIVGDAQSRIDDHLMGKQHVGYARIRATVDEMMVCSTTNYNNYVFC